jgi:polyisoprenoid-binding protein YceI
MLEKTLDAERFPFALIRASRGNADLSALSVTITLHGATRTFEIPVQTETLPGGIAVSGRMTFNQTDFGIIPYSVLGGALQVQDRLDLRFRILVTSGWGNEPN